MESALQWMVPLENHRVADKVCAFYCCRDAHTPPRLTGEGWVWRWLYLLPDRPCLQHAALDVVQVCLWMLVLCGFVVGRASKQKKGQVVSRRFWITLLVSAVASIIHLVNFSRRLWVVGVSSHEILFSFFQFLTWTFFSALIVYEKQVSAEMHPFPLRVSWFVNMLVSLTLVGFGVSRWGSLSGELLVDATLDFVISPISLLLLVFAWIGRTGIYLIECDLTEALVNGNSNGEEKGEANVTGFADLGLINQLSFNWMNTVLVAGSQRILEVEDIPLLKVEDRVDSVHAVYKSNWDQQGSKYPVLFALLYSFWPLILVTGVLGLVRVSVMYVGPLLIQRFIDVTTQADSVSYQGVVLVIILFVSKAFEVISEHQFSFYTNKLGINVSSALISSIYRKGLRISSSSRQTHGTGKIVNYMSVDAQQISDTSIGLHQLWLMPLQIIIALLILWAVVGLATLTGIGTMLGVMGTTLFMAKAQQKVQVKIMEAKDYRIKVTSEALNNMKIIKLCAWQERFLQKVEDARAIERKQLMRFMYLASMNIFFLWLSPLAVSVFTFGTCVLFKIDLTPGRVFTAIATFRILQDPLRSFPQQIMRASQAYVSLKRLDTYLTSTELNPDAVEHLAVGEELTVVVKDGWFKWDSEAETPTLRNINIEVKAGSLVAIVGLVGSGKSALLNCILGEMEKVTGNVSVSGSVAYVAQSPWIQNGTLRDNILFGKAFDESLYKKIIDVCALAGDLDQMSHGDRTEIGERGINLSGGQKQRIQLARAVYQDADVYLLDDVFSAVDAHTGTHLYKECIRGFLAGKTVLLVTHQIEFLHGADSILVIREGGIVQSGKYDDLASRGTDFSALVDAHNETLDSAELGNGEGDEEGEGGVRNEEEEVVVPDDSFPNTIGALEVLSRSPVGIPISPRPHSTSLSNSPGRLSIPDSPLSRSPSLSLTRDNSLKNQMGSTKKRLVKAESKPLQREPSLKEKKESGPAARLIEDEERGKGRVGFAVYWEYATKVLFGSHAIALLVIQTCWQGLQVASDFWLAKSTSVRSLEDFQPKRFITVYAELALGSGLFVLFRALLVSSAGLATAQKLFLDMIRSIFRAPMSFFDTTPTGRILTRSSTDQASADFLTPLLFGGFLAIGFQLIGVLVVISQVTPQILVVIVPLSLVYVRYQVYFISTSRELTRLNSVTEAPIVGHFSESISGFSTIRAFGQQDRFVKGNVNIVDTNLRTQFYNNGASEWLGFRLESIGTFILCSSALLLVLLPKDVVNPGQVGLSLSYGLALNGCLFWVVFYACFLEQKMVGVERILQYTTLQSESPLVIDNNRPDTSWPQRGDIKVDRLLLRYRSNTPLVLKGVAFTVKGGEKLGIVGRTGSGKSSLIQALFRVVEPAGGTIYIDNVDITKIGLSDLRSRLSIIPQEPTLFEGNVRSNLDPLGEHSDFQVWEALEKCQLAETVRHKEGKLDSPVTENGENWSMGQRQLFCLGRALLKRSRILVLDEATASIDTQTDAVLQKIISSEFKHCTVISIAHRIPSVMDSDKVLVLDAGVVKEFGSPSSLLANSSSLFSALVREYWNRSNSLQNLAEADVSSTRELLTEL